MDRESILNSRLVQRLQSIRDYRAGKGKRYPLWMMLLIAILGVMSGCSHGRVVQRTTQVFAAPTTLAQTWSKAESLVV